MALLHYQNLADHRPDILMNKTFYGLKAHYDFLNRIKIYLESDQAVLRIGCQEVSGPPYPDSNIKPPSKQLGVWVELVEAEDQSDLSEKIFEAFLDRDVRSIYETGNPSEGDSDRRAKTYRHSFRKSREIKVLGRDAKAERLLLERIPEGDILLRPNTYNVQKQIDAIQTLQNSPSQSHRPLLRLFEDVGHADWAEMPDEFTKQCYRTKFVPNTWQEVEIVNELGVSSSQEWKVLTDSTRPGTIEQRLFVATAMNTPDFALLEGPPGSGKTTAICELILQLILEGKRVLLCASTHVAVDNVIEKLMEESNPNRHLVIPLRIGESDSISEKVLNWTFRKFVKTESNRIKQHLAAQTSPTASQANLKENIQNNPSLIERLVLDAANLVCGTTIGILKHPDIQKSQGVSSPQFDVMIIDEASKTTFQEFLVPALHAKRWILVGDPKQLSPYVDDQELAMNIAPCLPQSEIRNVCVDVFLAQERSTKKRRVSVVETGPNKKFDVAEAYEHQASEKGVTLQRARPESSLGLASIVIGDRQSLQASEEYLPIDATTFRTEKEERFLPVAERRGVAYARQVGIKNVENPQWENEISWRHARLYEQRFAPEKSKNEKWKSTTEKLEADLDRLMPVESIEGVDVSRVKAGIDAVRRVALPSILESLRLGFERGSYDRTGTALTDGLPPMVMSKRRVLLSNQHRMHPDIAAFSHKYVYHEEALFSPENMTKNRQWHYNGYGSPCEWLEVAGEVRKKTSNPQEASLIMRQLEHFDRWAQSNSNSGKPWEVAVLCFYRGQEFEMQQRLKEWTESKSKRYFQRGDKANPYLTIQLCTVDRFQGHEADLVFLSFSNNHVTSFLESPNRLNVALTRARYQVVIVGNRQKFKKSKSLIGKLASHGNWSQNLED